MIRLKLSHSEPQWLALGAGVRVLAKPLDMTIYQAALTRAQRETLSVFPLGEDGKFPPDQDGVMREAVFSAAFALALANYAITQWEGVVGDDGSPAVVSPDTISALMRIPALGRSFLELYSASAASVVAEGNA